MPSLRNEIKTALQTIMREDDRIIMLGQSIRDPYGGAAKVTRGMTKEFDGRIIDMPISESAMIGTAIGLAMQGFKPIVEIMFSDFLTLCAMQIRQVAGILHEYHGVPMKIIIRTMWNTDKAYGPSHSEDPAYVLRFVNTTQQNPKEDMMGRESQPDDVVHIWGIDAKRGSVLIENYRRMLTDNHSIHIIAELKKDYGKEIS